MVAAASCDGQSGIVQNTAKWGLEEMETQISPIRAEALMKPLFETRYIDPASNRISHILRLLGSAVLLPWPARSKGDPRKWKHLQLTDMNEPRHLPSWKQQAISGSLLEELSNGLVTIDFDNDDYVEAFLEANPLLRTTLRTTAQRGCNIWLRCTTDYPPSCKLRNRSGDEIGEWRADGNQTIIAGTHPDGVPYRFVVESPAIAIDYSEIVWPDIILAPDATESKRVRRVREKSRKCVAVLACRYKRFSVLT